MLRLQRDEFLEVGDGLERILEAAPNHPQALVRLGEIAAHRGEDPGSTAGGLEGPLSEPEELLDVPDVEREPAEMPGEGLDDMSVDLDEWTDEAVVNEFVDLGVGIQFAPDTLAEARNRCYTLATPRSRRILRKPRA